MRYKFILFLLVIFSYSSINAQSKKRIYENTYNSVDSMLTGTKPLKFQQAVYLTENAYLDNQLDKTAFDAAVRFNTSICKGIIVSGNIEYPEKDKEKATAQCAVFVFMTDSIPVSTNNGVVTHIPFAYNFDDFAGQKEWSDMFVSTLMQTKKGNCHSLPYLYKMIMDELGQPVYLSLAPNHIYIKAQNKRVGWYNIELTCGDFPTDAWLMASGYIDTDAFRNGIYMDTLSQNNQFHFAW